MHRAEGEVLLLGVSKTKPILPLQEAHRYGIRDFGENKVQEIRDKYEHVKEDPLMQNTRPRFHMIGALQKNKVKYLPGQVALIHSVDSVSLSDTIDKEFSKKNCIAKVLIEVNVAKEESKTDFFIEELEDRIAEIASLSHIEIHGLMTVAPFTKNRRIIALSFELLESTAFSTKKFPPFPLQSFPWE